jgi:hypothetical protein
LFSRSCIILHTLSKKIYNAVRQLKIDISTPDANYSYTAPVNAPLTDYGDGILIPLLRDERKFSAAGSRYNDVHFMPRQLAARWLISFLSNQIFYERGLEQNRVVICIAALQII